MIRASSRPADPGFMSPIGARRVRVRRVPYVRWARVFRFLPAVAIGVIVIVGARTLGPWLSCGAGFVSGILLGQGVEQDG